MKRSDVEDYLSHHAAASLAKKEMERLREILLPQLEAGEESPRDLPFLLERREADGALIKDYRSPLERLLIRQFGKKLGEHKLELIEAKFERKDDVISLHVVQNKLQTAVPALEALIEDAA